MNEERDVIGEVIVEDNARPIHPAVAEYAVAALHTATSDGERVAELELLNKELWRQAAERDARIEERDARIEELEREIERLEYAASHNSECVKMLQEQVAALKSRPAGLVLPERLRQVLAFLDGSGELDGLGFGEHPAHLGKFWWRTELRAALAELNLPTAPSTKFQTCQDSGVVSTTDKDHNGDHIEQRCPDCAGGVDERAAFDDLEADCREIFHWVRGCGAYENGIKEIVRRAKARALNAGSAAPDGFAIVPVELTAENGAKHALIGEFSVEYTETCPECCGDEDEHCSNCEDSGEVSRSASIEWSTIKDIWRAGIAHFATAPTAKKEG